MLLISFDILQGATFPVAVLMVLICETAAKYRCAVLPHRSILTGGRAYDHLKRLTAELDYKKPLTP